MSDSSVRLAGRLPDMATAVARSHHVREVLAQLPTDQCVRWPGKFDRQGYGWIDSKFTRGAHRYIYLLLRGMPDEPELDHRCHTEDLSCPGGLACLHRGCVNPAHLDPVSARQNVDRRVARVSGCRNGHSYDDVYMFRGRRYCRECRRATDRRRGSGGARAARAARAGVSA